MTYRMRGLALAASLFGTAFVLAGCGGGSSSGSATVTFRESDGMFSGGLLFHSTQVPPLNAMLSTADVYGDDGIDDLILVALGGITTPEGEGAFLAAGLPGGGFGEPMELGQRAVDSPAVADFDNDGLLDMVFARFTIEVYFANGDGTYSAVEIESLPDARLRTPLVADFDTDGDPDIAVAMVDRVPVTNEYSVRTYLNRGDGTFEPVSTSLSSEAELAGPPADFNGDGLPDLAAVLTVTTLVVLIGNGDGTFGAPSTLFFNDIFRLSGTTIGDLNGDEHSDIVSFSSTPPLAPEEVWEFVSHLSRGDGTFDEVHTASPFGGIVSAIKVDDVTEDGIADLIVNGGAIFGIDGTQLFTGNGDGSFDSDPARLNSGRILNSITGDLTGDGIKDIYGRGLIEGLGGGEFFSDPSIETEVAALWFAAADVYDNGTMDFVIGNDTQMQVIVSDGDGSFTRSIPVPLPTGVFTFATLVPITTRVGDLDGDGLQDVLVMQPTVFPGRGGLELGPSKFVSVLIRQDSTVEFVATLTGPPVGEFGELIDLNDDGALDVAGRAFAVFAPSSENPDRPAWATFGVGDGTFSSGVQATAGPVPSLPAAADLDADGLFSLLAGQSGSALLDIYHVDSDGNFALSDTLTIRDRRSSIAVGRLDTDDRDDFVLLERITGKFDDSMALTFYYGNAANGVDIGQHIDLGGIRNGKFVTIEHLDGDSTPYVLVHAIDSGEIVDRTILWVLRRTGSRQFSLAPIVHSLLGLQTRFVVDDFNLDGQPDIASLGGNTLQVLRGLGQGGFDVPLYFDVDPLANELFHDDFDSDGDLDVAALRASAPTITLKLNRILE